jgi:phage anti-repressor protein
MNTNTLIPVFAGELSGMPVQLVDARLLHTFLEVGKDFSTWIKDRIEEYSFLLNSDYLEYSPKLGRTPKGGRPAKDYALSIDMSKELGMIERNDKGRQIRRYFLDMEKVAHQLSTNPLQLPEAKTKKAIAGGLSLDQQDTIKALVKSRAEGLPKDKQAGAIIKQWSAIKKKYGMSYKEVAPENFVNIISLITRLPIDGELVEKSPIPTETITLSLNGGTRYVSIILAGDIDNDDSDYFIKLMGAAIAIMPIDKDHKLMNEQGAVNELISRGYIVMKKAELLGRLQA